MAGSWPNKQWLEEGRELAMGSPAARPGGGAHMQTQVPIGVRVWMAMAHWIQLS